MEAVVSVGVTGALMGGIVSVMSIATTAAYNNTEATESTYQARDVVSQVTTDLSLAQSFSQRTATSVTFTVPDRDGDGTPETIKYAWSGNAGGSLTRKYNSGAAVVVAEDVHHFNLGYITKTVPAATTTADETEEANVSTLGDTTLLLSRRYETRSYGGSPYLIVGGNDYYTALIGFDLSGVNFTIGNATLKLYPTYARGNSKLSVHAMAHTANNASWYEGTAIGRLESGAACCRWRSYNGRNSLPWENSSGSPVSNFYGARGSEIGSIDPDTSYSSNQWIEIPLDASAVEAYRSSGSISLNVKYASYYLYLASKENTGGNGPELILSSQQDDSGGDEELQESDETTLIEHNNASGGYFKTWKIQYSRWAAQYFKPTLPANTDSWKINAVGLRIRRTGGSNGVIGIEIRDADSNQKPGSTIRTQTTIKESGLSSSYQWVRVNLSPVGDLNPSDGYCLVVRYSSGSSDVAKLEYEKNGNPMTPNTHFMYSYNRGRSWSSPENKMDMRFRIYGTMTTQGPPQ